MTYKSTGTVRIKLNRKDKASHKKILFTPDQNHSCRQGEKIFAVFFTTKGECRSAKPKDKKYVSIRVHSEFPGISGLIHAAIAQVLVQVEVDAPKKRNAPWMLRGIVIPAPGDAA